jgi:septin family protein
MASRASRGRKQAKKGVQLTLMVVGESASCFITTVRGVLSWSIEHGPRALGSPPCFAFATLVVVLVADMQVPLVVAERPLSTP